MYYTLILLTYFRTVLAKSSFWRVLQLFWGKDNTMKLKQTIFGCEILINPKFRTCINQLYNMITVEPGIHIFWGIERFTFELVNKPINPYKQNLHLQWVPTWQSSGDILLLIDPKSFDKMKAKLTLPPNYITK